jgi:hypothetical protein
MKRNFLFVAVMISYVMFVFDACTKDIGKPGSITTTTTTGGSSSGQTMPDSCNTNIKFSVQIQHILSTYCTINNPQCHASTNSWGNFTTYAGFHPNASTALNRVKNLHDMPPDYTTGPKNQAITQCEISKLEAWVNAGAPNN